MPNLLPPLSSFFAAFGVSAVITPVGGAPVATTACWIPTVTSTTGVGSGGLGPQAVLDGKLRLGIRRDQIATLPQGSRVVAPSLAGGTPIVWIVSRVDELDSQVLLAAVSPGTNDALALLSGTLDALTAVMAGTVI